MNLKTTLVLLVLVLAAAAFGFAPLVSSWLDLPAALAPPPPAEPAISETVRILEQELTPEKITRIVVRQGDQVLTLERGPNGEWSLPGKWPVRELEVKELLGRLTGLRSRFSPVPLDEKPDLVPFGLAKPPVVIAVRAGAKDYKLSFGRGRDQGDASDSFAQATFLRVDDQSEVVRLAPSVLGDLQRPPDYYQRRQLFPAERVVKEGGGETQERIGRLSAKAIAVKEKKEGAATYSLAKAGDDWELREPVRDRLDPDKVKELLTAVPDLWAEQFVEKKKALEEYGLKDPEQTLSVTRPNGDTITLLIGKQGQMKVRMISKPGKPNPFGMPAEPIREPVHEEYRYAKLLNNDQVFEIKADKLKDIFTSLDNLRDARLARFRTEDARKLEVNFKGQDIVLAKDKERWRLEKPMEADAETNKVTELLDKLNGLSARGMDVIDKADAKTYGLDQPAGTIKVTVEEEVKGEGDAKTKKTKTFTFQIGKDDKEKNKLYVRMDGWERINAVGDDLMKLVDRPALAYRGRRIFDVPGASLAKVQVQPGGEPFTLEKVKGDWKLTAPVQADIDLSKVNQLTDDLERLEAIEYVDDAPKAEELDAKFGLAKPVLSTTLTYTKDGKETPLTLQVGKQRPGKEEFFAKLGTGNSVFAVKKEIHDALERNSLSYRPLQLWRMQPEDISGLRVQRGAEEYRLARDGTTWRITEPFKAAASPDQLKSILDDVASLKAQRYEVHVAKNLADYGLDQPHLRLAVTTSDKKEDKPGDEKKEEKEVAKERVLLIGKTTAADAKTRFAKLGDGEAIFVVGEVLVGAVDRGPLQLLDRKLLALDTKNITQIQSGAAGGTLRREGDAWQVEAGDLKFPADQQTLDDALRVWANLQAKQFAAYDPKEADLAKYGLDKPGVTVTVTLKPAEEGKEPAKHTLVLGKPVDKGDGDRYARLDNGPGVLVLGPTTAAELSRTYLDFADRTLLNLDAAKIDALQRKMGDAELEIIKKDNAWKLVKPAEQPADEQTMDALVQQLAKLRAQRVAAYQAKDLKPFGLEEPAAVLTLRLTGADDKPVEKVIKIGKAIEEEDKNVGRLPDRFVLVEGSPAVGVLSAALANRLLAAPIKFRDRSLARFADADQVILKRGPREAVFAKIDGTWKLTKPAQGEAEQGDLDDLINSFARLRADELVVDKPSEEELKNYGLDQPEARWTFKAGDKDVLNLVIGSREKTKGGLGARCYAQLAGNDLVFLLSPQQTSRVLGEYRKRSVWASLDAAQVETLIYGYENNPFTLQKVGENWQVMGKPDLKVQSAAVSDTLAALARLRVERFVVDKDADLKLYGLEPPALVLQVQTKTGGKLVLHVGSKEGESKRYYARVPDADRSDVFILSEADAGRIVRDVAAFTKP